MNEGVQVIWDESSAEAVAKLRAMNEAGNITWDLVDVVAADAIRLCDEGLAMEIDHDEMLAPAPDGTPASDDFGDLIVSDCFIPQIVYSTTVRLPHRQGGRHPADDICARVRPGNLPGQARAGTRPINNMEWALLCDGVAKEDVYDVLETEEGIERAFAKLDTIKDERDLVVGRRRNAAASGRRRGVIGSTYNGRCSRRSRSRTSRSDAVGRAGVRPRRLDHPRGSARRPSGPR
jgi:putative spermidine/putrescine transport system substrate-binding protein